jgi:mannose-6-phosphate isomerase
VKSEQNSINTGKNRIFESAEQLLKEKGLRIQAQDRLRPWGGFLVIEESQSALFIDSFFPHLTANHFSGFTKLSPKLLLVAPGKRLSWQYHHRRSEIWKVLQGSVGVVTSNNDSPGPVRTLQEGDVINLSEGERHRLVGLERWSILAEIWQHTDPDNPSDENDIVRVEDDFGR